MFLLFLKKNCLQERSDKDFILTDTVCMLHRKLNGGGLDAFSESDEEKID